MKKIVITIFSALLSLGLHAQAVKDYAYYIYKIDSLTALYSVDSIANVRNNFTFRDAKLSIPEKKKLIDKIRKLFEQKQYVNLYTLGRRLMYNMYFEQWRDNPVEIKQQLMDIYLQYYFYPGMRSSLFGTTIENWINFSKKGKKRLVELLEDKKTDEDYELCLKFCKSTYLNFNYSESLWREASSIMKKGEVQNDTILTQIKDSLLNMRVSNRAKNYLESFKIENKLIRMIGFMDMKECIPIMQRKLQEGVDNDNRGEPEKSYRCALARLGDKEQRQYILDHLMDIEEFDRNDFIYFQDDEMIWKYIAVNYFSDKNIPVFSSVYLPSSFMTINNIYPYIKNLPKELEYPKDDKERKIRFAWAESVYNWLITNKKAVIFDYAGEKDFEW
jgi:hypothetical protein